MADLFDVGLKDIGRAKIYIGGVPFDLIGVLNTSRASAILDLDQERLTPVDFIQMQRMQAAVAVVAVVAPHGKVSSNICIFLRTALHSFHTRRH